MSTWLESYRRAKHLEAEGCFAEAISTYREALREVPDQRAILLRLGSLLTREGRGDEAVEILQKATSLKPPSASACVQLGLAQQSLGRMAEAEIAFRAALSLKPASWVYVLLADVLWDQDRLEETEAALREAVRLEPEFDEPHYNLGILYRQSNRFDDAHLSLSRACALSPDDGPAHRELGLVYYGQGEREKAEREVLTALDIDPSDGWAYLYLGVLRTSQARLEEAEEAFRSAVRCMSDPDVALTMLAGALRELPWRQKDVETALRSVLVLDASNLLARFQLAVHLSKNGNLEEARAQIARILESQDCAASLRSAANNLLDAFPES